ncbi:hypothetical protein vBPaerPs25_182c [Pseudomonas phage vB_Paer_Ps25]|uniref:Uncharacterized protein n=1 Tax=Pseudomonas phage vB_Paer_Ps12 TaxID=2924904 RepID=A0AAE9GRG0_9CAUD|nr:hypothetical protein QE347_gp189 [Pseudomonas phage vB_Paer_Ps12]UOL47639.1 hypothetical protein vBPaerPs12_183c [Pseudomonas phage vB_Paer_Ps12]UOL47826.1 hypothetical protein vBPaerPs25_182c [Pseudomonas phage vB_Paer_Ps25]
MFGGPTPIRTENTRIWNPVGCQLRSPTLNSGGHLLLAVL